MAIDLTTLTDYSWTDIAKAAKTAMVSAAIGGGTLTINGRTIMRITIDDAKNLYVFATQMASEEAGDGGGIALVQFGES